MDEEVAKEFQRRYLDGDGRALTGLYAELRYMADQFLRGNSEVRNLSHQAASRLVERYIKHPGEYQIRRFGRMVKCEVAHVLADGGNGHRAAREYQLVEEPSDSVECDDALEPIDYATDLQRTSIGRRALLDLWRTWNYQEAIITIAKYAGGKYGTREERRQRALSWIYSRAVQLHTVYRMMHRGKKVGARESGRRGVAGDETAVQGIRALIQLRGEPHAPALESCQAER